MYLMYLFIPCQHLLVWCGLISGACVSLLRESYLWLSRFIKYKYYLWSIFDFVHIQGHKWSLSAFLKHLRANDINTSHLMQSIEDIIIKSIVSVEFSVNSACKMFVPHRNNCFEVYGFDILVDSNLKPWLLEVNMSPSLNTDSAIDMKIKSSMLCDLFTLIGKFEFYWG